MGVSALDERTAQVLRAKLEVLAGVQRVVVDESPLTIWIHCEPDCNPNALRESMGHVFDETGVDVDNAIINLLTDLSARRRVKFSGIERLVDRDGQVRVRVALEWMGELKYGEAVGEKGDLIEMRTSSAAALDALEHVLNEELGIKLVGVKQVKAFDAELMVVALYRSKGSPQRLVGSVSLGDDPIRAAAIAVLNALNRILGNYLIVRE